MSTEAQLVDEGTFFYIQVAPPVSKAWEGWPTVFQIVCKEYGVVVDEGVNEMQCRYYHDHYEKVKATYVSGGLSALVDGTEVPDLGQP